MATKTPKKKLAPLYGDDEAPYTITLALRGVTPFLFNLFDMADYEETGPGTKKKPRKRFNAEDMVWRNDAGELAYPVASVIAAICHAGRYFRTPIGSTGSAKTTLTEGLVAEAEALASFGVEEWDVVDERMGRNSDQKRSPRAIRRPRLDTGWQLSGVAITMVTPELIRPASSSRW